MVRKVIVAGSRDFEDYAFMCRILKVYLKGEKVTIVSGGARGADRLGERFAEEHGHKIKRFPAKWKKYGKAAGPIRNEDMADYSGELVAFWDGRSSGTKHMLKTARKGDLQVMMLIN